VEDCHGVPNSQWLFQYAVKLALNLVQATQDQREVVG